jgi:hypothetical protein
MLSKQNLRALSPGQWARVRVPDYEMWAKPEGRCRIKPGDEVDVCVMPCYEPRYDSPKYFDWRYRVAYCHPEGTVQREAPNGYLLSPWDFGLINATSNSPNWDIATSREHHEGKGKWLYEPASDDPELCPGEDWSRYTCSTCGKFVKPFSSDAGDLVCPWCEVTGLVILDDEQLDRLEQVRDFARLIGLGLQLERQLGYLADYGRNNEDRPSRQCVLGYDFAPHSFSFAIHVLADSTGDGKRQLWFNGGLIYQGPRCPANGSFPSLTVSLAEGTGWFCHT